MDYYRLYSRYGTSRSCRHHTGIYRDRGGGGLCISWLCRSSQRNVTRQRGSDHCRQTDCNADHGVTAIRVAVIPEDEAADQEASPGQGEEPAKDVGR